MNQFDSKTKNMTIYHTYIENKSVKPCILYIKRLCKDLKPNCSKNVINQWIVNYLFLVLARNAIDSIVPISKSDHDILKFAPLIDTALQENYTSYAVNGIYSMFVRASDLHVFRAVEPALRLKHSELYCTNPSEKDVNDPTITALHKSCIESRGFNLASRSQLARLILEFQSEHTPKEKA